MMISWRVARRAVQRFDGAVENDGLGITNALGI